MGLRRVFWIWNSDSTTDHINKAPTVTTGAANPAFGMRRRQKSGIYTNCENKHTLMFSQKVTEWNRTKSRQIKSNRTTKTWLEPNRPALKKLGSKQMKLYRPKPRSIKSKQTTSYWNRSHRITPNRNESITLTWTQIKSRPTETDRIKSLPGQAQPLNKIKVNRTTSNQTNQTKI